MATKLNHEGPTAVEDIRNCGSVGMLVGSLDGLLEKVSKKKRRNGFSRKSIVAKTAGRYGFQYGFCAGVYLYTDDMMKRYRKKSDTVNDLVAFSALGVASSVVTRNSKHGSLICAFILAYFLSDVS